MTDKDLRKMPPNVVGYNKKNIPLYISTEKLSDHFNSHTMPHWHEDLEFLEILDGNMQIKINNEIIHLEIGDCLVISGLQMHYSYNSEKKDCTFHRVLFHPELLTRNLSLVNSVIEPLLNNHNIKYFYLANGTEETAKIREIIEKIIFLNSSDEKYCELEIVGYIHIVLGILFNYDNRIPKTCSLDIDEDLSAQKRMIEFIHEHYFEKLTLEQIGQSGNVCRSKCCMIFKKYIQSTPINFLNLYRLEVSRTLLKSTDDTVSAISQSCGFANQSYFNKVFLEEYGCTPLEFRNFQKNIKPNCLST